MIKLRIANTEKDSPPYIDNIPETFDELYARAEEINKAEEPRKMCSYYMPINKDKFVILLKNLNGNILGYYGFERDFFSCSYAYFGSGDKHSVYKIMSIERLYYIVKGFLEGERITKKR